MHGLKELLILKLSLMEQAASRVEDGWAGAGGANDTSEDVLLRSGMAAFLLAALASSGVASPLVHRDNAFAVHALRQAMEATDLGAQMALADRYFHGRGVAQNCTEGMRSVCYPFPCRLQMCYYTVHLP